MPHEKGTGALVLQRITPMQQCGFMAENSILGKDRQFQRAGVKSPGMGSGWQRGGHWSHSN